MLRVARLLRIAKQRGKPLALGQAALPLGFFGPAPFGFFGSAPFGFGSALLRILADFVALRGGGARRHRSRRVTEPQGFEPRRNPDRR